LLLGSLLADLGEIEESCRTLQHLLTLDPSHAEARRILTYNTRRNDADEEELQQLQNMLESDSLDDDGRARIDFALGKAYDDLQEPEKAFTHFREGNQLYGRQHQFSRK